MPGVHEKSVMEFSSPGQEFTDYCRLAVAETMAHQELAVVLVIRIAAAIQPVAQNRDIADLDCLYMIRIVIGKHPEKCREGRGDKAIVLVILVTEPGRDEEHLT